MRRLRRSVQRSSSDAVRKLLRRTLIGPTTGLGLLLASTSALAQAPAPGPAQTPAEGPSTSPSQAPSSAPPPSSGDVPMTPVDVRAQRRGEYRVPESSMFKMPGLLKDAPQSISVVPQDVMREQAVFSVREALRNVTGLTLNAGEGGVQGDNLTLRGFPARNDLYLDGVRDFGAYTRDSFNLAAVEVLKGPSSVLFGRGSTGGVINSVSKDPMRTALYEVTPTVGSPTFYRLTTDVNQPLPYDAAVRFNAMYHNQDLSGRDEVHNSRWGVAPSAGIGLGGPTRLVLSYLFQQEDNIPDYGIPYLFGKPAPVSTTNFYGVPAKDFERTDVHIGTAKIDHAFDDNVKLHSILRYAWYGRENESTAPRIAGTPTPTTPLTSINVNRTQQAREREDSILASQTDLVIKFDTWFLEHTLTSGIELDRETADSTTFTVAGVPATSLVNPVPFISIAGITRTKNQITSTTAYTVGAYVVDDIKITPEWRIMGGIRWDGFWADFHGKSAVTGAKTEFDRNDSMWSPRAALMWLPTTWQTYYVSYGSSTNPSAESLTLAANTVNTDPEKTYSLEVGGKWDILQRLNLRAAGFYIEKTDARTTEPGSTIQTLDGKQRSTGFEVEATGRILPRWNIYAGYTFLSTRVLESKDVQGGIPIQGKELPSAPQSSASLWTTVDLFDRWQVGGGAIYVGQRWANNNNTIKVPGYAIGEATLAFRPIKNIELRLNVINISDASYYEQVYQGHTVPGAGRTFLFSGNFAF